MWCSIDPRSGIYWRLHLNESVLHKALKAAIRKSCIAKNAGYLTFRRCLATHLLKNGHNILTVQELLSYSEARTTMIYTDMIKKDGLGKVL